MRTSLTKSFLTVLLFWWLLAAIAFSLVDPNLSIVALRRLASFAPWLPLELPQGKLSVLDGWQVQSQVFVYWVGPMLLASLASALVGAAVSWALAWRFVRHRAQREQGTGKLFGVSITLGALPMPLKPPMTSIELGSDASEDLARFNPVQLALLEEILGGIAARESQAFVDPPGDTLLDQALAGASVGLADKEHGVMRALYAAALRTGNLSSHQKDLDGNWMQIRDPGRMAAQFLLGCPAWRRLPSDERNALTIALRNSTHPEQRPELMYEPEVNALVSMLLTPFELPADMPLPAAAAPAKSNKGEKASKTANARGATPSTPRQEPESSTQAARKAASEATTSASPREPSAPARPAAAPAAPVAAPKQDSGASVAFRVSHASKGLELSQETVHLFVFDGFVEMIPHITFQRQGLSRNVPADGWLKNRFHIYLIENRIREMLEKRLDPKVVAMANSIPRNTKPVALSVALLRGLQAQGWLIREHEGRRVETDQALWAIVAGTNRFNGILIAHVPEEHRGMLPVKDSHYDLTVVGPLFSQAGAYSMTASDLPLDLLRRKSD